MTVSPQTNASPLHESPFASSAPLSFAQQGVWLADQLHPDDAACTIPVGVRLLGPLDTTALIGALDDVVTRHEALRTVVDASDGEPRQIVQRDAEPLPAVTDLSGLPADERFPAVLEEMRKSAARRLDLADRPLRARLYQLGREEHVLFLAVHHIVWDGWSVSVFYRDLTAFYRHRTLGEDLALPDLTARYVDYAATQREVLGNERLDADLAYWREELGTGLTPLELPATAPSSPGDPAGMAGHSVPAEDAAGFASFARGRRVSKFMLLATALHAVLHRLTGADSVATSFASSTRDRAELENLVGLFVNLLVLRTESGEDPTFGELLGQVRTKTLRAFRHAQLPYEQLVRELRSDADRDVLGQVRFAFQNATDTSQLDLPGITAKTIELHNEVRQESLNLVAWEESGRLELAAVYDTDRFDQDTATRLLQRLVSVLQAGVSDPSRRLSELPILLEGEDAELRRMGTVEEQPEEPSTIHDLVFAQIARTPDADALVGDGLVVSYRELGEHANRLVRLMRARGVRAGDTIGLCLERSVDFAIASLAVFSVGAHYLPLDPSLPAARAESILRDARPSLVICAEAPEQPFPCPVLQLADDEPQDGEAPDPARREVHPEEVAYVLYTSGSTGYPKGVMVPHRGVVNVIRHHQRVVPLQPGDRLLHNASLSFDLSVVQLFWPLAVGAAVVIAAPEMTFDLRALAAFSAAERVTVLHTVASVLGAYLSEELPELPRLRAVFVGGERLTSDLVRRVHQYAPVPVFNCYGPTETAVIAAMRELPPGEQAPAVVPIGRPLPGVQCHVLDAGFRPVPPGVTGELYLGGECVSPGSGYLARPSLTAERYVPDPYSEAGRRLYRTGDLVRMSADGTLYFLGRIDRQLKLNGVRVEPGEVQAVVAGNPDVAEAYVTVRDGRLVAYVVAVAGRKIDEEALRSAAAAALPRPLLPSLYVVLDRLPLTSNGKLDEAGLPDPGPTVLRSVSALAPRTAAERAVAEAMAEFLGISSVGAEDDFFALGGHSLLAMRLASRIRSVLGVDVSVRTVFEAPTPALLAARLDGSQGARVKLIARPRPESAPMSYGQSRMWFLAQIQGPSSMYNLPMSFRISGSVDLAALQQALTDLTGRHEVLRTVLREEREQPIQLVQPVASVVLRRLACTEQELPDVLRQTVGYAFDLSLETPLRASLIEYGAKEYLLVLLFHHCAADGYSVSVLNRDLSQAYRARLAGAAPNWTPLPVQYADYALWQRDLLGNETDPASEVSRQLAYWTEKLAGAPAELPYSTDRPRPDTASERSGTFALDLGRALHTRLENLARATGTSLNMIADAALAAMLTRSGAGTDIPIGTPVAGRTDEALDDLIGFFINTLVLRIDTSGNPTFEELLTRVCETSLAAYENQDVPFERVVGAVNPPRAAGRNPLFQVMLQVAVRDGKVARLDLPGVTTREETTGAGKVKFDLNVTLEALVTENGEPGGLQLWIGYAVDLFDAATIERMADRLVRTLWAMAADPTTRLDAVDVLGDEERRVLEDWNRTGTRAPRQGDCVLARFEAQSVLTPDATAVVCDGRRVGYAELDAAANRLARLLATACAGKPEAVIGLCLPRGVDMIIALIAVWKAGAAYLPIDPEYPAERIAFMLADSGASLLVSTGSALADELPVPVVALDDAALGTKLEACPAVPAAVTEPGALAYVMYTSGSTGRPKGVAVTHGSLANYFASVPQRIGFTRPGARYAVLQAQTTDLGNTVVFASLATGGELHILDADTIRDPDAVAQYLTEHRIECVKAVPSHLAALATAGLSSVLPSTTLVLGGEAASPAWVEQVLAAADGCAVFNHYGPTEATIGVATARLTPASLAGGAVPVGEPIANTRMYVLDDMLRQVPAGVTGELYLAGEGLARGYIGQPGLTARQFVPCPFGVGERMYRTGDLARWTAQGQVMVQGRIDDQVKIRGFRVEPNEVRAMLAEMGVVAQAAVLARENAPGNVRLIAYVVPAMGADALRADEVSRRVRAAAELRLPTHMVPSAVVVLDRMPLASNGKLDREALRALEFTTVSGTRRGPADPQEELLCRLFAEVLEVPQVGPEDSFFDLGGHSVLATRLVGRIRAEFECAVSVRALFEAPTPGLLARWLVIGGVRDAFDVVYPIRRSGSREPLFCLHSGSGLAWVYSGLTRELNPEIPVYGIQSLALARHRRRPRTLAALVAEYVGRIREVQPRGPYRLLGWSFGGVLAHEAAVQLQASGEQVELLAILDADIVPHPELAGTQVPEEFLNYQDDDAATVGEGIAGLTADGPASVPALRVLTAEEQSMVSNAWRYHRQIRPRHAGGVFEGDLLLVRATADKSHSVSPEEAWGAMATGTIEELRLDCTHFQLLDVAARVGIGQSEAGAALELIGAALNKALGSARDAK